MITDANLRLCAMDRWTDVDALPAVASLQTLQVANVGAARNAAAWRPVLAALREKGVAVTA